MLRIVERAGIAVDDAPVSELDLFMTLQFRMPIEVFDARDEFVRIFRLRGDGLEHGFVETVMHERGRQLPQLGEMPVEHENVVDGIDDQHGIGRAFDRRRQQRAREGLLVIGALALGDVGDDAFNAGDVAGGVAQRAAVAVEPDEPAVSLPQAEFDVGGRHRAGEQQANLLVNRRQVLRLDKLGPAGGLGQQIARGIAVAVDVLRQIAQRIGRLRRQPVENGRAVLDDAVGVGQALETRGVRDCRADQFRQGLDGVDLGRRPVAFAAAVVEADEPLPLPVGKHRNAQRRFDAAQLEQRTHRRVEVADMSGDGLATLKPRDPVAQPDLGQGHGRVS